MFFCSNCNVEAELGEFTFRNIVGVLVFWRTRRVTGIWCRRCAVKIGREFNYSTMAAGWWSPPSALITPFFLIMNAMQLSAAKALAEPPPEGTRTVVSDELRADLDAQASLIQRFQERDIPFDMACRQIASQVGATPGQVFVYLRSKAKGLNQPGTKDKARQLAAKKLGGKRSAPGS